MIKKIRTYISKDVGQDLIWNYISIVFLALGGVTFSFLLGYFYDATVLGYFNKMYAIYVVFSQIMVWGSHMAVTKYVSEHANEIELVSAVFSAALVFILLASTLGGLSFWGISGLLCHLDIVSVSKDFVVAIILGTFFFAINKAILGLLNGMSCMKEYAVLQSFRNVFIAGSIIVMALLKVPGEKIVFCFAISEFLLLFLGVSRLIKYRIGFCFVEEWFQKVVVFGTHIMPANIVLELSTKVDILCLSVFMGNDAQLGVYSFASLFSAGFYQLFVVVRRNINPKIAQEYQAKNFVEFYNKVNRIIRIYGYAIAGIGAVCIVCGYNILCLFMKDVSFREGNIALCILLFSIVCNSRSIIWGNILSQTGFPIFESIVNILTILANIIGNIFLIQMFGINGAAISTGFSYFFYTLLQKYFVKTKIFCKD